LEELNLSETKISDQGLDYLRNFPHLKTLFLDRLSISDEGLSALAAIKPLSALHLSHDGITGRGLARLGQVDLEELDLADNQLTDPDLQSLLKFKNLAVLSLSDTGITDAGLKVLEKLSNLKTLMLEGCPNVSASAVSHLHKKLPLCHIQT
jgi:Leucine-rich repeat (LRR) protein